MGAAEETDAATIEANVVAAMGPRPAMEQITSKISRGGANGTEVCIRSGDDYRIDTTLGPLRTAEGMIGGVRWKQNANGETVVNTDDPREPSADPIVTTVTYLKPPFERYVIARVDSVGNGTREVIDPLTWRVIEIERITSTETTTTLYSAFTASLGYVRAWQQSSSDGYRENDSSSTIVSDVAANVTKAMLAVPDSRRTLVAFPRGKPIEDLPVRLTQHGDRFIVHVIVGTHGLDFLLDTGAGGISIDRDAARHLGLRELDTFSNAESAGRYVGGHVIAPAVAIGDLKMRDVVLSTIPHAGAVSDGVRIDGLLGFDFLDAVQARIDYESGRVTVFDPQVFDMPAPHKSIALDVRLGEYAPEVRATIDGRTGTRFILDTAGVGAAIIVDHFRRAHRDAFVDASGKPRRHLVGIGGTFDATLVHLARITVGSAQFDDQDAFVIDSPKIYGGDFDGIIGPDILRQFTIFLDFGHGRVYLDPTA